MFWRFAIPSACQNLRSEKPVRETATEDKIQFERSRRHQGSGCVDAVREQEHFNAHTNRLHDGLDGWTSIGTMKPTVDVICLLPASDWPNLGTTSNQFPCHFVCFARMTPGDADVVKDACCSEPCPRTLRRRVDE
ncbi:hypothetical protein H310_05373 [Aphanomyces invadans]|uniref:Uncharacterized protein n=1 Tax=Aphanomyces invadans TaxID=157072 RepID=A0A024U9J2_9STRA|nr:hypothetical protein H310_05373 [Aphanomyces invadans]ETW02909.1 hypothetical protein H310_05373 [Aphanomyces invadans]|eukprot:XP_008868293.1 hypothetical protein H310_05373 [Aphanomyces invadans]